MTEGYQVIYADPPWSYDDTQESGGTAFFGASARYPTQSLEWVKQLPQTVPWVWENLGKDSALFMWSVSPLLPEALEVIEAWGFKFKTIAFCWSKHTNGGKDVANMGRWTMGNVELCLLATKGSPKRVSKNVRQLIRGERTHHSAKPPIVRELIVELMGDVPRIELFARPDNRQRLDGTTTFDGWDSWGNEMAEKEYPLKEQS